MAHAEQTTAHPVPPELSQLQAAFRDVMAAVATPVSVITAVAPGEGLPFGTTVSAFASLSMAPPMVLVSLDRGSELLAVVRGSGRFGVNVLGSQQSAAASNFARRGGTGKFSGVRWDLDHGVPRIPGAPGWLACEVAALVDGGDHVVVLGTVTAADRADGAPLIYRERMFGTYAPLERSSEVPA